MTLLTAPPISLRRARTAQPQGAAGVDWSNSISRGLAMLTSFGANALDAKSGQLGAVESGASIVPSPYGMALRSGSGPAGLKPAGVTDASSFMSVSEYTIMMLVRINSLGTLRVFCGDYNAAGGSNSLYFYQDVTNVWAIGHITTQPQPIPSNGGTVTIGWHWIELVFRQGVSITSYVDGAVINTDVSSAILVPRRGGTDYRIGRAGAATTWPFDGDIAFHGCWNRMLSPAERASVRANPWQLFTPLEVPAFNLARGREPVSVRESVMLPTSGPAPSVVAPIILTRRKTWAQQPPERSTIDRSSTLSRGLLFHAPLHPQWGMLDLVSGTPAVRTGLAAQGVNKYGALPLFGASNYADFTVPPTLDGNKPVTIAWVQEPRSTSAYSTILNIRPAVNAGNAFLIYEATANAEYSLAIGNRNGTGCAANFHTTVGVVTDWRLDFYVATNAVGINDTSGTLGNFALWRNGVKLAPGGASTFGLNDKASFRVGALDSGSDPFEGLIGGMTIWQRVLSDPECLLMSSRPSVIYTPTTQPIWGNR